MMSAEVPNYAALAELRTTSIPEKQLVFLKPVFTKAYERKVKLKTNDETYSVTDTPDDVLQKARIAHGRSMLHLSHPADMSVGGSKRASMVRLQAEDYLHARPDTLLAESDSEYDDADGDGCDNDGADGIAAGYGGTADPEGPPNSNKSACSAMGESSRVAAAVAVAASVGMIPPAVLLPSRSYCEGRLTDDEPGDGEEEDEEVGVPPIIMIHGHGVYGGLGEGRAATRGSDKGDRSVRGGRAYDAVGAAAAAAATAPSPVAAAGLVMGSPAVVFSEGAQQGEGRLADQLISQLRKLGCGTSGAASGPVFMPLHGDVSVRAGRHYMTTAVVGVSISSPSFEASSAATASGTTPPQGASFRDPSVRRRGSTSGVFNSPSTLPTDYNTTQQRPSNSNIRPHGPLATGGGSITEPLHFHPHGLLNGTSEPPTTTPRFSRHSSSYLDPTAATGPEYGNGNGNGTRNVTGSTGRVPERAVRAINRAMRAMTLPAALGMTYSGGAAAGERLPETADANLSFRGSPARVGSIGGTGSPSLALYYHASSRSAVAVAAAAAGHGFAEGEGSGVVQLPDLPSVQGSPQPASAALFKAVTGVEVTAKGGLHDYSDYSTRAGRAASQLQQQQQQQQQLLARAASGVERTLGASKLPKINSACGSPAASTAGAFIPTRRSIRDALGEEWLPSRSSGDFGRASSGAGADRARQRQDEEVASAGIVSKVKGLFSLLKR